MGMKWPWYVKLWNRIAPTFVSDKLDHPGTDDVCTLEITAYRQGATFACGYVAGLMILHTFHKGADKVDFLKWFPNMATEGTDLPVLVKALKNSGVAVRRSSRLSLASIVRYIDDGCPIVTRIVKRSRLLRKSFGHWVIIYGYGCNPDRVFIAGNGIPWISNNEIKWEDFQGIWNPPREGLICWGE